MKEYIVSIRTAMIAFVICVISCTPEQEVAPIEPPDDNALITITPDAAYSTVREGDELSYTITVDKMLSHSVEFTPVFTSLSTADGDDIEVVGGKLEAYAMSTTIMIIISADAIPETIENLKFEISAKEDYYWNWQLHPDSDREMVDVTINDYDFSLDWSEGAYENDNFCEWGVDLDIYPANVDFSEYSLDGATGACPLEHGTFNSLPDETYDIYVEFWESDLPDGIGVEIPYVATFSNNNGEVYTFSGTFNSDDVGESRIIGQVIISNGVYTLYDANGGLLGTM